MWIAGMLLVITPIADPYSGWSGKPIGQELTYTKKKRKAVSSSSTVRRFKSCKDAMRAGYSHMRRGQRGYSPNLDRDGDGVACDKEK